MSPGDETQWDWPELPGLSAAWGWGKTAHLLVGSLAHSGKWRGYLAPSEDQPHLVAGLDRITRGLGGCTRVWRFDRMATVCDPGSGRVTASFAGVAKHYGVSVAICPPRRANRKGVVERSITPPRNAGGAPWPMKPRLSRLRPAWIGSPAYGVTPGCGPPPTGGPRSPCRPQPSPCSR